MQKLCVAEGQHLEALLPETAEQQRLLQLVAGAAAEVRHAAGLVRGGAPHEIRGGVRIPPVRVCLHHRQHRVKVALSGVEHEPCALQDVLHSVASLLQSPHTS